MTSQTQKAAATNSSTVAETQQQPPQIYHERQRKQLCLLHTLNNLLQRPEFQQHELDTICESLDDRRWFNAHRSWIGMGNYDANILLVALQSRGLIGRWFDRRLPAYRINQALIIAYIFNIPSSSFGIFPFFKGRHWFPVVQLHGTHYNLDSKLTAPEPIDNFDVFTNGHLSVEGNELLLVVRPEHEEQCVLPAPNGSGQNR